MKSLAYSKTQEYHREYTRRWRTQHPHYTRNWNRLHRNKRITDIDAPSQGRKKGEVIKRPKGYKLYYQHIKKGHCDKCTILLTSKYAWGHNGKTCGECLHRLSTVVKK